MKVESALRELKEDKDFSNKTYNDYLQAFDQFCKWLSDGRRAILIRNPIAGMQRLNSKVDVRATASGVHCPKKLANLLMLALKSGKSIQCYTGLERAQIYLIAYFTGLRRAEIASLTPASFDLTAKRPTFRVEAGASKNGNRASLPIHSFLAECLQRWLDDVPRDQVLFPKLAKRKTSVMVERDLEQAGIPYRNSDGVADFHALRHTYISNLVNLGGNVAHARSLARHADIRTTDRLHALRYRGADSRL